MEWFLVAIGAMIGYGIVRNRLGKNRLESGDDEEYEDGREEYREEREYREGRLTLTRESVQIPRSIRIRKILLDTGEEEPERLNLDERWVSRMPRDGSRVRLALSHSYIAGVQVLEEGPGEPAARFAPSGRRLPAGLIPLMGVWALCAVFFSSFVFFQLTDTDPVHKITLYVDGEIRSEEKLAALLEKGLPDSIRMVQIHPFRYAMFGSEALKSADLFIVPDSEREQFAEWFAPGDAGIPVYDPASGISVAGEWILYRPEEVYRLYSGAASPHLEDGLAAKAAKLLIDLGAEGGDASAAAP